VNDDFYLNVSRGVYPHTTAVVLAGHNPDVDAGTTPETLWPIGGPYPWPTAPQALEVVSDSANDTALGTGARTAFVTLLDSNYVSTTLPVTLNGLTPVPITGTFLRVNDARADTAGSTSTNVGNIDVRVAGGGTVLRRIVAAQGRSQGAVYTIPAGKTGFFLEGTLGFLRSAAGDLAEISARSRVPGKVWEERTSFALSADNPYIYFSRRVAGPILERADFEVRVIFAIGTNAQVRANLALVLCDN
jgi:hypothetical protein